MFSFFKAWAISPKMAALIASLHIGRPDLADDLVDICMRESRCTKVEAHEIDAHISDNEWYGQTKIGRRFRKKGVEDRHLDSRCQKRNAEGGWATHGPWGTSAGTHWPYMPPCYQPSDIDEVYNAALLAARKYERECWGTNTRHSIQGWCRVKKTSRKNNLPSPKLKSKRKIERPKSWFEFYFVNP